MRRKLPAALIMTMIAALIIGLIGATPAVQAGRVTVKVNGGPLVLELGDFAELAEINVTGTHQQTAGTLGAIDISDARGTGAGWNVIAQATDFVSRENDSHIISAAGFHAGTAPVTTIAGNAAPPAFSGPLSTPLKLLSAAPDSGMGHFQAELPVTLDIPADVFAGTYDSTLTLTISSGP